MKRSKEVGDAMHKAIKDVCAIQAFLQGYLASYCDFMPSICKHNMTIIMGERRDAYKDW